MAGKKNIPYESCRSCSHHYKNKVDHVRMCSAFQQCETTTHTNQNGHVRHLRSIVFGHTACIAVTKGAKKCRKYKRNSNKPLQVMKG